MIALMRAPLVFLLWIAAWGDDEARLPRRGLGAHRETGVRAILERQTRRAAHVDEYPAQNGHEGLRAMSRVERYM
jgi:hypothetical protein